MDDAGLAQVFETLIATGLRNFLGCPAVFYEAALTEFFTNGSVREDGMVVSTIRGTTVEISESLFATAFDLPTEGLTDLNDVPKDKIFDARSLFSASKEQVIVSCFKKEMKIEYRILHDILAKTIFVKAGSFDAVTRDRFLLMTAIMFDVKVNWSSLLFGVLKAMAPGSDQFHEETDTSNCRRRTCVTLNGSGIQLAVGPQPLRLRNHNFGLAQRIMVKRLATSRHDPLGITDSSCKNQLVVVSVQYGPFNTYIPIRSTIIGKSRVARDPIAMRTSWRSNSDIASVTSIGYPRMRANGESSTTKHRLLHASGSHPIPPPNDPKTNQYNQDLGLIHSTNGNHLESPNEGSSIDHQVTIHMHAQNITMFPTNETWYFASQMLVSSSGGLILILTAQSTRNEFRIHSDY
ncbi:hypothetical protein F511_41192 [Dorcoceras hygrometricum]|uniref:Uncharacterized protein n=1 Tax=Dorcoceras hygrometricum TaxID=472368 RepID=A0A2Z7C377_9LAMI|nr:hypothetical protein F511_41192 [Dorcoceras hygrometricum]